MAPPADTSADAWARQFEALRALPHQERVRLALTMSEDVTEIVRAGIRHRHPEWPDERVHSELVELVLGSALAQEARPR